MALASGTRLGPYEIVSALGAGGMGEVYRARDTRLDRTVAIKVLPSHLSASPALKQRFEREARAISSLNHPHICHLYDVGAQDGTDFLVMEFLEGEPLDKRLQKGPLPLKQALEFGMQIAEALEKAHRAGIVHRDLKPGNIMLTASGAKLLDFGLAKPAAAALGAPVSGDGSLTPSTPTMNLTALSSPAGGLTQQGTIVGTFQYMAPEVIQGKDADARSDIFSLGCVLYEMVTAKRAFEGKSQLSVLTAILEKDPEPLAAAQPTAPPALDYTVQTCLEKNPDNRFQTAHDVKLQLAWVSKAGSQTSAQALAPAPKKTRPILPAALALLAVALIAVAAALWPSRTSVPQLRVNLLPPDGAQFETLYRNGAPTISPDGTRLVFVARKDDKNSLWLRPLDKLEATQLRGTEDAYFPFWSPDGSGLAFFMHGKLWRMTLDGSAPVAICDIDEARGGFWGGRNQIVFTPTTAGPVMRVAAEGGVPKPVTVLPPNSSAMSDRWPVILPDGKHFLFLRSLNGDADDRNEIRFASMDGGASSVILRGRYYTFQYSGGWLLAQRAGSLQASRFDPASGKVSGDPMQLFDKPAADEITGLAAFSLSPQGTLVYQPGSSVTGDRHVWMDAGGKLLAQISTPAMYGGFRLAPDGARVMVQALESDGNSYLWVWDLARGTRARLSPTTQLASGSPVWSRDGRTVYFARDNNGRDEVYGRPADGSGPEQVLIKATTSVEPKDLSPDGKWLLYAESIKDSFNSVLKAFPLAPGAEAFTVLEEVSYYGNVRLRPGAGDWCAYQSATSGRGEVYLTRFPKAGARYQVSQSGGSQPVWSTDGKKLFYLDSTQKLAQVEVRVSGDSVELSPPKTLFQTAVRTSIPEGAFEAAADGRFLFVNSVAESTAPVVLVTNWDAELKK